MLLVVRNFPFPIATSFDVGTASTAQHILHIMCCTNIYIYIYIYMYCTELQVRRNSIHIIITGTHAVNSAYTATPQYTIPNTIYYRNCRLSVRGVSERKNGSAQRRERRCVVTAPTTTPLMSVCSNIDDPPDPDPVARSRTLYKTPFSYVVQNTIIMPPLPCDSEERVMCHPI